METATFGIMVERTEVEILLFFGGACAHVASSYHTSKALQVYSPFYSENNPIHP